MLLEMGALRSEVNQHTFLLGYHWDGKDDSSPRVRLP